MKRLVAILFLLAFCAPAFAQITTRDVVIVIGQSQCGNPATVGVAYPSFVPTPALTIWGQNSTAWETLQPGINTDGGGAAWGPEVSFGKRWLENTGRPLSIIKHCPGSVGLAQQPNSTPDWSAYSTGKVFSNFYGMAVNALNALLSQSILPVTKAIVLVGGDSDTASLADAQAVPQEVRGIQDALRARLNSHGAKFIISRVPIGTAGPYTATVRAGQNNSGCWRCAVVSTDSLTLVNVGGGLHFNWQSSIQHGIDLHDLGYLAIN